MALQYLDYAAAILLELDAFTDADQRARLTALMPLYWDIHVDKGGNTLRYLYVKRSAIDALLGGNWESVDLKEEDEWQYRSQRIKNLQTIRNNVDAEINRLNGSLTVSTPTAAAPVFISAAATEFG